MTIIFVSDDLLHFPCEDVGKDSLHTLDLKSYSALGSKLSFYLLAFLKLSTTNVIS